VPQVTSALDRLVEPLGATLTAKVKADAVKQEVDRNEDMLRSCLRCVDALAKMPAAAQAPAFKQFMEGLVLGPALKVGALVRGAGGACGPSCWPAVGTSRGPPFLAGWGWAPAANLQGQPAAPSQHPPPSNSMYRRRTNTWR
jgi:hypothetical protein